MGLTASLLLSTSGRAPLKRIISRKPTSVLRTTLSGFAASLLKISSACNGTPLCLV